MLTKEQIKRALKLATPKELIEALGPKYIAVAFGKRGGGTGGARPNAGRPRAEDRCYCGESSIKTAIAQRFNCCKKAGVYPKQTSPGGARSGVGRPREKIRCHCEKNSLKTAIAQSFNCCKKAGVYPKQTS